MVTATGVDRDAVRCRHQLRHQRGDVPCRIAGVRGPTKINTGADQPLGQLLLRHCRHTRILAALASEVEWLNRRSAPVPAVSDAV